MFGLQELLESTIEKMAASGDITQHSDNGFESIPTDIISRFSRRYS